MRVTAAQAASQPQASPPGRLLSFLVLAIGIVLAGYLLPASWSGACSVPLFGGGGALLLFKWRRQLERALKGSEERLRVFQRIAGVGSWDWELASGRFDCSEEACRIFGVPYGAGPVSYQDFLALLPPQDRDAVDASISQALAGEGSYALEHSVQRPDGTLAVVSLAGELSRDASGTPLRVLSVVHDITAQKADESAWFKEAESALYFEMRYRALIENLPQRIFLKDSDSVYLSCNSSFARELGLEPRQVFGKTDYDLFPSALAQKRLQDDARVLAAGVPEERDEQRERDEAWVSKALIPLKDDAGRINGLLGILTDITSRKRAEEQLKESEERFRNTFEQAAVGICHLTLAGGLIRINRRFCDILGYTQEELLGRTLEEIIHPEDLAPERDKLERLLRREIDSYSLELRHLRKDGSVVWVNHSMSLVRNSGGVPKYFAGVIEDVTAKREAEALRQERDLVQASSRAMSQFLANMSHEIRTPMNAVIGLGHLVLKTELTPKQREYLEKICSSSRSLLEIINDILDFSKIEAGRIELECTDFSLEEVLKTASDMLGPKAQEKGVGYRVRLAPELPGTLLGDPVRLVQVLNNLIGNAVKFTEKGEVVVDVRPVSREAEGIAVRFSVRDTGVGLTPEQMERIFTPFIQADSSTTRRYGGTGLGLSISSQLVELMGGALGAESLPGVGSNFFFTVHFGVPSSAELQGAPPDPELRSLRLLALDADPSSRDSLARSLAGMPFTLEFAAIPAAALAALERAARPGETPFDLMLISEASAGADGLETVCREIGNLPIPRPAILATVAAERLDGMRERAADLDLSGVLGTPAGNSQLLDGVVRALSRDLELHPRRAPQSRRGRPEAAAAVAADPLAGLPGLDFPRALKRLGGNRALLVKLLHEFRNEFSDSAAAIGEALGRGETELARHLSHTLKGVSGNLSISRVHAAALALETASAGGAADSSLRELELALAQLVEGIERLPAPAEQAPPPAGSGSGQARLASEIAELERLLSKNSLDAKRQFARVRGMLPGRFLEELRALEGCMEKLDFKKARMLLARLSSRIGEPAPEERGRP